MLLRSVPATGGMPANPGAYTARINWGDGTPLADATITAGSAAATTDVSGRHTYTHTGAYTVAVTVDDGVSSTITTTTVLAR